jgi:hypothetical protein
MSKLHVSPREWGREAPTYPHTIHNRKIFRHEPTRYTTQTTSHGVALSSGRTPTTPHHGSLGEPLSVLPYMEAVTVAARQQVYLAGNNPNYNVHVLMASLGVRW